MLEELKNVMSQHYTNLVLPFDDIEWNAIKKQFEGHDNVIEFFMKNAIGITSPDVGSFVTALVDEEDEIEDYKLVFEHHIKTDLLYLFYNV